MKKAMRMLFVAVMCIMLAGGVGIPNTNYGHTRMSSTVATVQAKEKINKKFKKAMNEYFKFYKKYCKFMKKYKKGASTSTMLSAYNKLVKQQAKVNKTFKKWKNKKVTPSELAYYNKINSKVIAMLSKV